jgi:long-chain acyl-CoA synthetase
MTSAIVDAFQQICRDHPGRPLLFLPAADTAWTAAQLWEAAQGVGRLLDDARVNPRGLLITVLGNRPVYLATFLACRLRNQPLCPLDASTTPAEIAAASEQLGASAILMPSEATPDDTPTVRSTVPALPICITRPVNDPGDSRHGGAAVLKMTSGSSGAPRATLTSEAHLISDSRTLMATMGVAATDVQIAAIPLSHAYGIGNLLVPLLLRGTPIIMRDGFVPQRLPDDARRFHARGFPGVPFMFDHFVKNPPIEGWPPTLTTLISAGAALETAVAERFRHVFGVKIHPFYGTSETGGITYDASDAPASDGLVGTPFPGVQLELVPVDGAPADGGRVLVRGPSVIQSYADNVDAASFAGGGFLTGDLGTIDGAGRLTLSGRVSSFVNVAGRKVQPDEVERVLRSFDGIADVRVIGMADSRRGEQLVACVVVDGRKPTVMALRQFCGARLASHKIPRAFVFLDEIPLTERGKTDRIRLRETVSAALTRETNML